MSGTRPEPPEDPHQHRWQIAGVDTGIVLFGCECGDAISTRTTTHPITQIKALVHRLLYEAKPDAQLEEMPRQPASEYMAITTDRIRTAAGSPGLVVSVELIDKLRAAYEDRRR